jgi:hypothetical protein
VSQAKYIKFTFHTAGSLSVHRLYALGSACTNMLDDITPALTSDGRSIITVHSVRNPDRKADGQSSAVSSPWAE